MKVQSIVSAFSSGGSPTLATALINVACGDGPECTSTAEHEVNDLLPVLPPALPVSLPTSIVAANPVSAENVKASNAVNWFHSTYSTCAVLYEHIFCFSVNANSIFQANGMMEYNDVQVRATRPLNTMLPSKLKLMATSPDATLLFVGNAKPSYVSSNIDMVEHTDLDMGSFYLTYNSDSVSELSAPEYVYITTSLFKSANLAFIFGKNLVLLAVRRVNGGKAFRTQSVSGLDSLTGAFLDAYSATDILNQGQATVNVTTSDTGNVLAGVADFTEFNEKQVFPGEQAAILVFAFRSGYVRLCTGASSIADVITETDPHMLLQCEDAVLVSPSSEITAITALSGNAVAYVATASGDFFILTPDAAAPGLMNATKSPINAGCHVRSLALHPAQTQLTFSCSSPRIASIAVDPETGVLSELSFTGSADRVWIEFPLWNLYSISYSRFGTHLMMIGATDDKAVAVPLPVASIATVLTGASMPAAGVKGSASFQLQPPPLKISNTILVAIKFPQSTMFSNMTKLSIGGCTKVMDVFGNVVYGSIPPDCIDLSLPLTVIVTDVAAGAATMAEETALFAEFRLSSETTGVSVSPEMWEVAPTLFNSPRMPIARKSVNVTIVDCATGAAMPTVLAALTEYSFCLRSYTTTLPTVHLNLTIGRVADGDGPGMDPDDRLAPCLFTAARSRHLRGFFFSAGVALSAPLVVRCTAATESVGSNRHMIRAFFTEIGAKWESAAFAVAPTVTVALRVAQGSSVLIDPPTLPVGVKFMVQSTWNVAPVETISLRLSVDDGNCAFAAGNTVTVDPWAFHNNTLTDDLAAVQCSSTSATGASFAAELMVSSQTAAFVEMNKDARPVIGTLFMQGSSEDEPFVFSADDTYDVALIASPTPAVAVKVELTMTRNNIPLPQMACWIMPDEFSSVSLVLVNPVPMKIKCSRPVAHEEHVEIQLKSEHGKSLGYEVLNGNVITAYIGITQSVWPTDRRVAALTTARLSLIPARPLSHKTTVLYEVITNDVRCALAADKTALAHMTDSQEAFDHGDFGSIISMNKLTVESPIGATALDVYALCDMSAVLFTVRVRYTVLKGTPLRDTYIGTGVFDLDVRNRMHVRSLVQPLGDTLIDNIIFKNQPAPLRIEYAFYNTVAPVLHVNTDHGDVCKIYTANGSLAGSEIDIATYGFTGVENVFLKCSEPRANVTFSVSCMAFDGTVIEEYSSSFHINGMISMKLASESSGIETIIAGPGAATTASVPLLVLHTLFLAVTPSTPGAMLYANFSNQSGKCHIHEAVDGMTECKTDDNGVCKMTLACDAPAQTPPSVIVHSRGFFAFAQTVSTPLQTKGNLVVEQLDLADSDRPYYLAGVFYRVRVGFDPQPEEPVVVRVVQTTTAASCMFTLADNDKRMQRTIQWQHVNLADTLVFGLICSRPHSVGSIIAIETTAYMPYNLGPMVTYGRMSLEFRMPTDIVGTARDVTDMSARLALSNTPVAPQSVLPKPFYLRAPVTNMTTFRLRMQPAVVTLTVINFKMSSAVSGCQFSIAKPGGGSELLGAQAQIQSVLGETERDLLISCDLPKTESFYVIAEITSGSPYVPLVSLPMQPRGTVRMTTAGIAAGTAFTGEVSSLRRWVMRFVLSPLPPEPATLTLSVVTGPSKDLVSSCRFYGETDADVMDATRPNTVIFTSTMVTVGVAMVCDVSLENSAFIQVINNENLYDNFFSAPFRVRGAVWTEDAALPAYTQFPGTASTYGNVAVAVPHPVRVRVMPTWPEDATLTLSVNTSVCGVALLHFDDLGLPLTDGVAVMFSVDVLIPADQDTVHIFLLCSTVAHFVSVTLGPRDATTLFAGVHVTGAFSARNRYEVRRLPDKLHAREPVLIELGVLPSYAIMGAGQTTAARVSTNTAFANCSVSRASAGASSKVPIESAWASVNTTASFQLTISSVDAVYLWVRCWQHTVNGAGVPVEGATKPLFKFDYVSGIAFLPTATYELEVVYIDCGAMVKLTNGNVIYDDNGFGPMAFLARATAVCETGYDLVTSAGQVITCATLPCSWSTTCQAAGWGEAAPHCAIHNCGPAPVADNKTATGPVYTVAGDNGAATTYGAVLTYGCANGFESASTTASLRCTSGGWSQPAAPACMAVTCPALTTGANTL